LNFLQTWKVPCILKTMFLNSDYAFLRFKQLCDRREDFKILAAQRERASASFTFKMAVFWFTDHSVFGAVWCRISIFCCWKKLLKKSCTLSSTGPFFLGQKYISFLAIFGFSGPSSAWKRVIWSLDHLKIDTVLYRWTLYRSVDDRPATTPRSSCSVCLPGAVGRAAARQVIGTHSGRNHYDTFVVRCFYHRTITVLLTYLWTVMILLRLFQERWPRRPELDAKTKTCLPAKARLRWVDEQHINYIHHCFGDPR
jgi:hypothetical protein